MATTYTGDLGTATIVEEDGWFYVEVTFYDGSSLTNDFLSLSSAEGWIYSNIDD